MTPRSHRFQSLGHDPVLGFVVGVLDILRGTITGFSYEHLAGKHELFVGEVPGSVSCSLLEALLREAGHLISDVATPAGLPARFLSAMQFINGGKFGEKSRSTAEVARWMYANGYDLRHFFTMGISPGIIEAVVRAYALIRHYATHGEIKLAVASSPKYRSMLLAAHSVAALANAGKVWLYGGNPLAINEAQWIALVRYLLPSIKYWIFDKDRLSIEYLEKVTDSQWSELMKKNYELLSRTTTALTAVTLKPEFAEGIVCQTAG